MSAFIVEDKVINVILGYLHQKAAPNTWEAQQLKKLFGVDCTNREAVKALGDQLFQMNIDAINQRYGPGSAEDFRSLDYKPVIDMHGPCKKARVLKAINCLQYQCSEGNVDELPLFSALSELGNMVARDVAENSKEYSEASWN